MKIKEKMGFDFEKLNNYGAINIVIFGDSVSHGCFDHDIIDYDAVYWKKLQDKIYSVRNYTPVNIINSAIGGTSANQSLQRLDRDVISHHPDLCIVCFGLNDVNGGLEEYTESLRKIFDICTQNGIDVIFMTPNMLNTYSADDTEEQYKEYSLITAEMQNSGRMDRYISEAVKTAKECKVAICDCYSEWKKLQAAGEDITMLLANRINHPTKEMHNLFADMLFETIFGKDFAAAGSKESTMYRN